jgi:hypothetical protein
MKNFWSGWCPPASSRRPVRVAPRGVAAAHFFLRAVRCCRECCARYRYRRRWAEVAGRGRDGLVGRAHWVCRMLRAAGHTMMRVISRSPTGCRRSLGTIFDARQPKRCTTMVSNWRRYEAMSISDQVAMQPSCGKSLWGRMRREAASRIVVAGHICPLTPRSPTTICIPPPS